MSDRPTAAARRPKPATGAAGRAIGGAGLMLGLALAGCTSETPANGPTLAVTASAKSVVGAGGGKISVGHLTMTIPPGALSADTSVTIEMLSRPPAELGDFLTEDTPVYKFSPEGLTFAADVEVRIQTRSTPDDDAAVLWTENGAVAFVPFVREGTELVAKAKHFSYFTDAMWANVKKIAAVAIGSLEVIGAVNVALYCRARGLGLVDQRPCPGARDENGKTKALCLGPVFTGGVELVVDSASNKCVPFSGEAPPSDGGAPPGGGGGGGGSPGG